MKVCIIGGGLAGSLLSIYMARRGYDVEVFEKRSDSRLKGYEGGRSINLALSHRGIRALKELGIAEQILPLAIPMHGRMIHDLQGNQAFFPYGKDNSEYINSISRGGLNEALISIAEEYKHVRFHFETSCQDIDFETNTIYFNNQLQTQADLIIATDGAGSVVRHKMIATGKVNESVDFLDHGYKELEIPAGKDGSFLIDKNSLHIWGRDSFLLIALPNLNGSFTVTLFLQNKGEESFETLDTPEKAKSFFHKYFPDALALMPDFEEDFFKNPVGVLATLKTYPWVVNKTLILGDAAHAVVPFYGQGMNASFEDCIIFNDLIDEYKEDWDKILSVYQEIRKKDTDAIADLAVENFYEMRDRVNDEEFQRMRKLEHLLENTYPKYHSKYSMVTFHPEFPYSVAKAKGNKQNEYLLSLCKNITDIQSINIQDVYEKLKNLS
ncbi:MAG: FAD-dependent monooxygenase [Raineya sp.]|jgi:kynurenine 3-monooxygenase|nr:FAD-dependent monooxygenase [Raineya sp.]